MCTVELLTIHPNIDIEVDDGHGRGCGSWTMAAFDLSVRVLGHESA